MKKMISAAKLLAAAAAISMLAAFPALAMTARIAFTDPSAEVGKELKGFLYMLLLLGLCWSMMHPRWSS